MPNPVAYLAFDGNCAEAVRFYEQALGGKIEMLMDGANSPMPPRSPRNSRTASSTPASRCRTAA